MFFGKGFTGANFPAFFVVWEPDGVEGDLLVFGYLDDGSCAVEWVADGDVFGDGEF